MTDAPERIYIDSVDPWDEEPNDEWTYRLEPSVTWNLPYLRADLVPSWQPIETAPDKDMECDIWVYVPPHATGNGIAAQVCAMRLDGQWVESWSGNTIHPTHWMPLHEPPDA